MATSQKYNTVITYVNLWQGGKKERKKKVKQVGEQVDGASSTSRVMVSAEGSAAANEWVHGWLFLPLPT